MVSKGQKRSFNVYTDDSSDEFDYEDEREATWGTSGKISNNNTAEKRQKRYSSSDMNEQFQNYSQQTNMAMSNKNGDSIQHQRNLNNEDKLSDRRRKCFSKNALMARANRHRKKLYLQNLEESVEKHKSENKKLSSILDNQSHVISDLRKELKYFKNILANSKDISKLLKCINQNTGMSVATSINKNLTLPKNDLNKNLTHPWAESNRIKHENDKTEFDSLNGELPLSPVSDLKSDFNWDTLFSDFNLPLTFDDSPQLPEDNLQQSSEENGITFDEELREPKKQLYNEHNYTTKTFDTELYENVGICLHIAQQRVSLEFCSTCSEKAMSTWNDD